MLVAKAVGGTGTVAWYDGAAGYTVAYAPPNGAAVTVAVTGVTVLSAVKADDTVIIALGSGLVTNDNVDITAEGTNPVTVSTDSFTVTPGNGTPETTTNAIAFGSSVTSVDVTAAPAVAGSDVYKRQPQPLGRRTLHGRYHARVDQPSDERARRCPPDALRDCSD